MIAERCLHDLSCGASKEEHFLVVLSNKLGFITK